LLAAFNRPNSCGSRRPAYITSTMKATAVISLAVSFTLGALFLLHIRTYRSTADTGAATTAPHAAAAAAPAARGSAPSVAERQLLEVIRVQNETIALLEGVLANKLQAPKLSELLEAGRQKDAQIQNLLAQVRRQQEQLTKAMVPAAATAAATTKPPTSSLLSGLLTASTPAKPAVTAAAAASCAPGTPAFVTEVPLHGLDQECERKYGMQLVDLWRANREVWCEDTKNTQAPEADKSRLVCYPYHQVTCAVPSPSSGRTYPHTSSPTNDNGGQEHKKRDGRGPDLFCEATNVFVDFSKVHGDAAVGRKPPLGQQYLAFDRGSIFSAACERTPQFKPHLFMPHHAAQMASFWSAKEVPTPPAPGSYDTEDAPTYLLARDEDCENSFHSTADFMNVFLVMSALGIDPRKQKVVLFDKHLDGPYVELIQKAFSPSHPVGRHQQYKGRTVLFKRLVFHLESPAGLIFPKVALPGPLRCHGTGLFNEYRKFVLQAFKLYDVPPPEVPTITLSLRYRTPHKNVGRVLKNKDEVVKLLQEGTMVKVNVIDAAKVRATSAAGCFSDICVPR